MSDINKEKLESLVGAMSEHPRYVKDEQGNTKKINESLTHQNVLVFLYLYHSCPFVLFNSN
jgi:hypothetical protein